LIPFQVYTMNGSLKRTVSDAALADHLLVKIRQENELGPMFDRYTRPPVPLKRIRDGKFVLYTPLLRFPGFVFESYFDPSNAIVAYPGKLSSGAYAGELPVFEL